MSASPAKSDAAVAAYVTLLTTVVLLRLSQPADVAAAEEQLVARWASLNADQRKRVHTILKLPTHLRAPKKRPPKLRLVNNA